MTLLNSHFSSNTPLRHVKSFGAFHVYKRQPNQSAIYYLKVGGQVKHQGRKSYIMGKSRQYALASINPKSLASVRRDLLEICTTYA